MAGRMIRSMLTTTVNTQQVMDTMVSQRSLYHSTVAQMQLNGVRQLRMTLLVQELTLLLVLGAFPSRTASLQSFIDHVHYTSELVSLDGSFSEANQPYAGMGTTSQIYAVATALDPRCANDMRSAQVTVAASRHIHV